MKYLKNGKINMAIAHHFLKLKMPKPIILRKIKKTRYGKNT